MDFDRESSAARLRALFQQMDEAAQIPFSLALFGGCAMTLRGLKQATKDVDGVLLDVDETQHEAVRQTFAAAALEPVDGYYLGGPLDAHTMLVNDDTWFDLFLPDRIMAGLVWSESFSGKSSEWFTGRRVRVSLADPSTIFLLKAVTGRWRRDPSRDLPDMRLLMARGLVDFDFVRIEWARQVGVHPEPERLAGTASEAVALLAEGGLRVPWHPSDALDAGDNPRD